ncbi:MULTISPECIES: Ger(x)C family spore germination protein [Bacillaceae]|uniref:Ger(X)C family spore germination protein n=1 Tax=Evansella alkalicola TaxID=745819 RepID=A0ABS6JPW6_9BACI|nr:MULTISPECIES: Ger(x)C family spore germination protein [Bacillaceae]MBU9720611.1 Ger(x)C family spore germination protein [Bacillus alkalicola]
MRKVLMYFLIVNATLVHTACWDRVELNDIALVSGTSVDLIGDKEYQIGLLIPLPSQLGGAGSEGGGGGTAGDQAFYVDSETGRTNREALNRLQNRMSRTISLGHRRIVIVGQELAKNGISNSLDTITRQRESRLSTLLLIARGEAIDVLNASPHLEQFSSEAVRELSVRYYWQSARDFYYELYLEGKDPFIPIADIVKNKNNAPEFQSEQIEIRAVGIFKDDKLNYITNEDQSLGVLCINERMAGNEVIIPITDEDQLSAEVLEQSTSIDYTIENDRPKFEVTVEASGSVIENEANLNLENPDALQQVEEKMNEQIETWVLSVIEKNLENSIDTFGFGALVSRKEPKLWDKWRKDWRDMLPNLDVEITIDGRLQTPGFVGQSIGRESED